MWAAIAAVVAVYLLVQVLDPERLSVEVASVRRAPLRVTVEEQGQTRVRDRYTVAAPITGRLLRTDAKEGLSVASGDVLATMAPPPEDPRVAATVKAELDAAEARLHEADVMLAEAVTSEAQARREAERRRELHRRGAISIETREKFDQEAQSAHARLDSARASVSAAQADVERARSRMLGIEVTGQQLHVEEVRAPVSGTVLRVYEESERVVPAGTPLFEIGESRSLELVIDLLTEDAVPVKSGDTILVTGWGGPQILEGRVRYVEPQAFTKISTLGVEEQRVNVIGDLPDPPASLGAAYRIDAAIVTWSGEDVLSIPTSAIFRRDGAWRTFAVEDGKAQLRAIEVGHRGKERAELTSGLAEGEIVILYPSDLVEDGVRVRSVPSGDE